MTKRPNALAKFRTCAAYRLSPDAIATVAEELLILERLADLSGLMDAITAITGKSQRAVPA